MAYKKEIINRLLLLICTVSIVIFIVFTTSINRKELETMNNAINIGIVENGGWLSILATPSLIYDFLTKKQKINRTYMDYKYNQGD